MKSLAIDHARDGEVMLAYAMNGEQLPLLNGFPLRLIVPGWYSTYWVKMLSDIEVLDQPDTNYWTEDGLYDPGHAAREHPAGGNRRQVRADQPYGAAILHHKHQGGAHRCKSALRRSRAASIACSEAIPAYRGSISRATAAKSWQAEERSARDEGKYSFRQWQHRFTTADQGRFSADGQLAPAEARTARRSPTRPTGIRAGSCATSSSGQPSYSREEGSMLRPMLPIALVVGVALAPVCARADSQLSLEIRQRRSAARRRHVSERAGRGCNQHHNCLACHSADMVLNQPAMSKVRWQAEVDKMRTAYKAPIDPQDVDAILDYLVSVKGEK